MTARPARIACDLCLFVCPLYRVQGNPERGVTARHACPLEALNEDLATSRGGGVACSLLAGGRSGQIPGDTRTCHRCERQKSDGGWNLDPQQQCQRRTIAQGRRMHRLSSTPAVTVEELIGAPTKRTGKRGSSQAAAAVGAHCCTNQGAAALCHADVGCGAAAAEQLTRSIKANKKPANDGLLVW